MEVQCGIFAKDRTLWDFKEMKGEVGIYIFETDVECFIYNVLFLKENKITVESKYGKKVKLFIK